MCVKHGMHQYKHRTVHETATNLSIKHRAATFTDNAATNLQDFITNDVLGGERTT